MFDNEKYAEALEVLKKQIELIMSDDRDAQMELYDDHLYYEFPFAVDRPRVIDGKRCFYEIMKPMWEEARTKGAKIVAYDYEFHATDEAGLYLALFSFNIELQNSKLTLPYVQIIRIETGKILSVKEYFDPIIRKSATSE